MPQEAKSKYNPKIGNGFENAAFGEGSILVNVDAAGLDAVMKNLQVGSSILLKFNKVTTKGNKHYFAEILPPYNRDAKQTRPAKVASKATAVGELD